MYPCVATGMRSGLLEVVPDSVPLAVIQGNSVLGAFKRSAIVEWFRAESTLPWPQVQENFLTSLAGAVVFEFVCGCGDRHADNVMVTRLGHLFHIDFALILGHDYGPAASSPFTLTPLFAEVFGGAKSPMYARFCALATRAYMCARRQHALITTIFMLAMQCQLPHLSKVEDLHPLHRALAPQLSDEEAAARFRRKLEAALHHKGVQVNDAMHNMFLKYAEKYGGSNKAGGEDE